MSFLGVYTSSRHPAPSTPSPAALRLLEAPPHVLPPPNTLCTHLMRRLLPPATPPHLRDHSPSRREESSDEEKDSHEDRLSSAEEGEREEEEARPSKVLKGHSRTGGLGASPSPGKGEVKNHREIRCQASNYQWLVNYFQKTAT